MNELLPWICFGVVTIPILAYFTMKFGTFGVLQARRKFKQMNGDK